MSNAESVIAGFVLGGLVSFSFYRLGRVDADVSNWVNLMFTAILRLKLMTPTTRGWVKGGFGLSETENYLTCLAETISLSGWKVGSEAIASIVSDMKNLEEKEKPNESERAEGETQKKKWEAHLYRQVKEISRPLTRLRLALPEILRPMIDSQIVDS